MLTNKYKILVGLAVFFGAIAVLFSLSKPAVSKDDSRLAEIFEYLGDASFILATKPSYDAVNRRVDNKIVLQSSDKADIKSFLEVLRQGLDLTDEVETVFVEPKVFTADYKVELACKKLAVIDFIFYEGTNAVCLRNEDHFFFAQLSNDSAEIIKGYFQN